MWLNNLFRYFKEDVPLRAYIVGAFFIIFSFYSGSWALTLLLFPLYWQIFFKKDLAPDWMR